MTMSQIEIRVKTYLHYTKWATNKLQNESILLYTIEKKSDFISLDHFYLSFFFFISKILNNFTMNIIVRNLLSNTTIQ